MAKWDTITTDFPGTTLPSGFNPYGTYSVSGNKLRFPVTGSNYAGATYYGQDLTSSYVMVRAEPSPTAVVEIAIYGGGTYRAYVRRNGTSLTCRIGASVLATLTYDATAHAWWRIREASGTTYCETAPDGLTWTVRASLANPASLTSVDCDLASGGGSATSESAFSKFNMVPTGGGSAVTGTAAGSFPALSGTATGIRGRQGTAAGSFPALSASSTSSRGRFGTAALAGPAGTFTATGAVSHTGAALLAGPTPTFTATGRRGVQGTATGAFGGLVGTGGAAGQARTGTGAFAGPALLATGVGTRGRSGTATGAFLGLSGAGLGVVGHWGLAAAQLGALTALANALGQARTGTAAGALGALQGQAVGQRGVDGTALGLFPGLNGSGQSADFVMAAIVLTLSLASTGTVLRFSPAQLTLRQAAP